MTSADDPTITTGDGDDPIVTEPLKSIVRDKPDDPVDIVLRVRVDPSGDVATAYAQVPALLAPIQAAIARIVGSVANDAANAIGVTWSGAGSCAPVLYATMRGRDVETLAADPSLKGISFQIGRENVRTAADSAADDADHADVAGPAAADTRDGPSDTHSQIAHELIGRIIAEPLASNIRRAPDKTYAVIIVLDTTYKDGREAARTNLKVSLDIVRQRNPACTYRLRERAFDPYVFAQMKGSDVVALIDMDHRHPQTGGRTIFRVWEDTPLQLLITKSIATVKADAAQIAYSAMGKGIVWAVLDSGVDGTHPHFQTHDNLTLPAPLRHQDFTADSTVTADASSESALRDRLGHGTHVAGIIAGAWRASAAALQSKDPLPLEEPLALTTERTEAGADERVLDRLETIAGMAPQCTIVSMKVVADSGPDVGYSAIIDAFDAIQRYNDYGRTVIIHGVNLSVGFPFDAKWFACGQSPLCVEVDRLVRSGVVVVAAAGNSGYGTLNTTMTKGWSAGMAMTINDPGNADLAITVGSTHRDAPHVNGVSYFSSKGPTGDGRLKPDLVAPGERIISCASAQNRRMTTITKPDRSTADLPPDGYTYKEDSGTSMAAPHVSGLIAAFLSIRREYIGKPEAIKELFVSNATDLKRDRTYQGAGLADLIRTIQAV